MNICMYIYIHIEVYIVTSPGFPSRSCRIFKSEQANMYKHACICWNAYVHACVYACNTFVYMNTCIHACAYLCNTYVYMCVCMCLSLHVSIFLVLIVCVRLMYTTICKFIHTYARMDISDIRCPFDVNMYPHIRISTPAYLYLYIYMCILSYRQSVPYWWRRRNWCRPIPI